MLVAFTILSTIFGVGFNGVIAKNERIVGGTPTEIEEAPYMVQIIFRYKVDIFNCGGTIIAKNVILTAAHCVSFKDTMKVRVGTKYNGKEGMLYDISHFKIHDLYSINCAKYDIALIWLTKNLEYSEKVAPIELALPSDIISDGTMSTVLGWGRTIANSTSASAVLMKAVVPTVNREKCKQMYSTVLLKVFDDMICTDYMEEVKGICFGDSGGPLVANGKQWGIASWVFDCGMSPYPGVFASVTYYREWINKHVEFD